MMAGLKIVEFGVVNGAANGLGILVKNTIVKSTV